MLLHLGSSSTLGGFHHQGHFHPDAVELSHRPTIAIDMKECRERPGLSLAGPMANIIFWSPKATNHCGRVRDSSAHTDLTHLYTQVMCLICAHTSDSSVHTTGFWRLICTHNRVGFRGRVSGFRGGDSGWGRDDMRPAWKRGTPQQGHFHMSTPLFGDFRVSGWGFGVGLRGGVSG